MEKDENERNVENRQISQLQNLLYDTALMIGITQNTENSTCNIQKEATLV